MAEAAARALTIGHSNHPFELFLGLLRDQRVEIVADTRSQPYSRYAPQYDREALKAALDASGILYLFFGGELGGRPSGAEFYDAEGHVLYDRVAVSPLFQEGLARLEKDLREFRVALLCSEENPTGCHRRLLIGRVLGAHGFDIQHIRGNGRLQPEADLLREEAGDDVQLSLFEHDVIREWKSAGIRLLLDVRLNNISQLAGFAKRADLAFFLREICGAKYVHEPLLAPTQEMLEAYRSKAASWEEYDARFLALMADRRIERELDRALFEGPTVLLCSEPTAERCHRRLVLEYLREKWGDITITHL
jgi:uncharacterized protein (DUF488 family)